MFLGFLFIISAFAVIGKAIFDLISHSVTTKVSKFDFLHIKLFLFSQHLFFSTLEGSNLEQLCN